MKLLRRGWRRLVGALAKRRSERELADEVASHIAMQVDDNLRAGMSRGEAVRAAQLKFGGVESVKESYRDQRGLPLLESLLADLRFALRGFRKSPGFTVTAIAALALGIGATTAIFSIVNTVLLKPLPVPDPDRFVVLMATGVSDTGESDDTPIASPARFMHWRAQSSVLQDVSAFLAGAMNYTGGDVVEQWHSMQASADTFRCWRIPILQGRGFTQEEDLPNGPRVAVISQGLWKRRFASDPQMLGKTISLSGEAYTVIGIVADSPGLLELSEAPSDVYVPFRIDPDSSDQGQTFFVVARLKPGVTLDQAKERLRISAGEFRAKFPKALGPKDGFTVSPLREVMVSDVRPLLLVLMGAVSLVLLIACANVASLLLVRAAGRSREIGIRVAIGAGRGRVIRQLLTESGLLSITGGALGLWLGHSGIRALLAVVNPTDLPLFGPVAIDWRVMVFALAVSLATGIVFGLFPALQASRVDLNTCLKDSSGRSGTGLRHNKARAALVVSEVSLAVILLVGSALLIRTFVALYKVERGFETKNVVTMRMSLTSPKYSKSKGVEDTIRNGLERLRALPGVVTATATCCVPLQGQYDLPFDIVGRPVANDPHSGAGGWSTVAPGFFEVFRIPVKRGRTFTGRDDGKSPAVVVINETMAQKYWKDGDPLKDRIAIGRGVSKELGNDPVRQIVGIVGDVRDTGLNNAPRPIMYVPQAQLPDSENAFFFRPPMAWVVRTQTEPHRLAPAIQRELRQMTGLPVSDVHSMDEVVRMSTAQQRFNMLLMTVFGCAALLLAAIGVYGLMAYSVEQRKQEIGIRLALGAEASQVKKMVVLQGMRLALMGVMAGLAAAWGLARLMESLLFGVKPRDPMVFIAVPMALGAVALLAVWLPANRASRVDPVVALRHE
jgi:putative ABC transport system permease protein